MVESDSPLWTATVVLVGATGIAIVGTELFGGVPSLDTVGLTMALLALAVPLTYVCYKVALSPPAPAATQIDDADKMDPEEVKRRTEPWSEEAAINPAYPPGQGPETTHASSGNSQTASWQDDDPSRERADDINHGNASRDLPDMEFAWQTETDVSFNDIGGMTDLKNTLRTEVIQPLENPEKAEELGVGAPNVIFHGPPGTGKTFTAEALATELGLPFASLSGADIQSKWINESSTKVNDLFSEAKKMAAREDGAIVFIDELDSVLKKRSADGGAHEEDNKVVNEFLIHLEDTKDHNILFVGATNRPEALDDAGIRSGRIDLKVKIGKPDPAAREAILRVQLAGRKHEISDETIAELSAATDGAVAADLEQLVNRAAKNVLSRGGDTIYRSDFD